MLKPKARFAQSSLLHFVAKVRRTLHASTQLDTILMDEVKSWKCFGCQRTDAGKPGAVTVCFLYLLHRLWHRSCAGPCRTDKPLRKHTIAYVHYMLLQRHKRGRVLCLPASGAWRACARPSKSELASILVILFFHGKCSLRTLARSRPIFNQSRPYCLFKESF